MKDTIRLIMPSDIKEVLSIYKPYIESSVISFETEIPSVEDFTKRVNDIISFYPWLVYDTKEGVAGYAYACPHRKREAYKWSVDLAIYLRENEHGKGIGKKLYSNLINILVQQGFYNAYAGIALPNKKSVALHEKMGFKKIGEYNKVGYKFGKWWNVGWWEYNLNENNNKPEDPKNLADIEDLY